MSYNNTQDPTYNGQTMFRIMEHASSAIVRLRTTYVRNYRMSDTTEENDYWMAKVEERQWYAREVDRYPLHPVIEPAVMLARPRNWQLLLLEHPHIAQGDRTRIAYTQSVDKGKRDTQTVTSVGKYLFRHFDLPDHTIRDLVARYASPSKFKFVYTTAEMIYHLHKGPGSCMVWRDDRGVHCSDGVTRHPYEVYDPKYGWHMAVRMEGDETVGRALCMLSPDSTNKYFVRTYAKPAREGGYSETDNAMENWLCEQGYEKRSYWENGEKLAYHATSDSFLAPYLDGNDKGVSIRNGYIEITDEGDYLCDQTGGCPTDNTGDYFDCEECGDSVAEDDGYWAGLHDDIHLCQSCIDDRYRYVYGRRGNQYHVHEDNVVFVESQDDYFDEDYLSDNDIVQLDNGDYEHTDNAIEIDGDWYHIDDERICRTTDTDEFMMCDDGCWQCAESGNWYSDDCLDWTEYEGERYHDDYIPARIADATADKTDDAEDDTDTKPERKMLTLSMLDEVALTENYGVQDDMVRFSMTVRHNGTYMTALRDVTRSHIAVFGIDNVRTSMRQIISTELLHMDTINAKLYLESTSTI